MPTKKVKLKFEPEYNFRLLGIVCNTKDYLLCHTLNQKLEYDLVKQDDIEFQALSKTSQEVLFTYSFYKYQDEIMKRKIHLIENKMYPSESDFTNLGTEMIDSNMTWLHLLSEAKEANFFLQCFGHWTRAEWNAYIKTIREITIITALFEIDPQKLKSKEILLLE